MLGKDRRERKLSMLSLEDFGEQSNDMFELWQTFEHAPLTPPLSPKGEEYLQIEDLCATCSKEGKIIKDIMFSERNGTKKTNDSEPKYSNYSNCTCSRRQRDCSISVIENCVAPTAVFPSCCIQEKPKTEMTSFTYTLSMNVETPNMTSGKCHCNTIYCSLSA